MNEYRIHVSLFIKTKLVALEGFLDIKISKFYSLRKNYLRFVSPYLAACYE